MEKRRLLAVFMVTNSTDSDPGSLRSAIVDANLAPGPDSIVFDIGTAEGAGPHTINLISALPTITDTLTIDGFSESGASENQLAVGNDASMQIVLDGSIAGAGANGLRVSGAGASGTALSGLVIGHFSQHGVLVENSSDITVSGNFIGLNQAGDAAAGNTGNGVQLDNVAAATIGGNTPSRRNVISANQHGVRVLGATSTDNTISGNYIGTDITGTTSLGNTFYGVTLVSGASDNHIGTDGDGSGDEAEGNVISGNLRTGIRIQDFGTDNNTVAGNFIGTDVTGEVELPNGTVGISDSWGILVYNAATGNVVGTDGDGVSDSLERNVISGNVSDGIRILSATANVVAGNFVGTNQDGQKRLGNRGIGVYLSSAGSNRIGTDGDGVSDGFERNIVAANGGSGIQISGAGADNNWVAGNYVGTDVTGAIDLGNTGIGLVISGGASDNIIGSNSNNQNDLAERNVISGNDSYTGVLVTNHGTNRNVFAGNYIGTDAGGTTAMPNNGHSFSIWNADDTRIGTNGDGIADDAERNLISGNRWSMVVQGEGTERTVIAGNYIGTNAAGTAAVANGTGIELRYGAKDTRIGTDGSDDAFNLNERNVISGNSYRGIIIRTTNYNGILPTDGSTNDGTIVAGNFIGLNAAGDAIIANGNSGIHVQDQVTNLRIGTNGDGIADQEERNVISGNTANGIEIYGWAQMNLATVDGIIAGKVPSTTAFAALPQADFYNTGNSGTWTSNHPIPGGGGDTYLIQATATLQVTTEGWYSFAVGSDNGSRLRINGTDVVVYDVGNVGFRENFGSIYLSAGTHSLDMIGYEVGGGSNFEVSVAVGNGKIAPVSEDTGWRVLGASNPVAEIKLLGTVSTTAYYPNSGNMQATIAGNFIGTDAGGTVDFGNHQRGIRIRSRAQGITIGTNGDGQHDIAERNVISGNNNEGVRIQDSQTSDIVVAGNYIGTDLTGTDPIPNWNGVAVRGFASNIRIGTDGNGVSDTEERNILSGNSNSGVLVFDSTYVSVAGNYIGTDVTGTHSVANGQSAGSGIVVGGQAKYNTFGTDSDGQHDDIEGNLVSGNNGYNGVFFTGASVTNNVLAGNLIGTDVTGTLDLGNRGHGVEIKDGASFNLVGTDGNGVSDDLERNIISGNTGNGVYIWIQNAGSPRFNTIAGNYIGTDVSGLVARGNDGSGVFISAGASDNLIGSNGDGTRDHVEGNVISGNAFDGVGISAADNNIVAGNLIGTDRTGVTALPNSANGILLSLGAGGNVIGGSPERRNVIAANATGVAIDGAGMGNWIASNYVGLGADGSTPLSNVKGITVNNTLRQIIGTNSDGSGDDREGNVVTGNASRGIELAGNSEWNVIAGNIVGTAPNGLTLIGSQGYGVTLGGNSKNNLLGTDGDGQSDAFERNVIAGAQHNEVELLGAGVTDNRVAGNYVGLAIDGTTLVLAADRGITIEGGASNNFIGTNSDGIGDTIEGNVIAGTTQMGVRITASDNNRVAGNLIGTERTGLFARPNRNGVVIENGATGNVIGTDGDGIGDATEGNLISGSTNVGVWLNAAGNIVAGNRIGTDQTGTAALGNAVAGVVADVGGSRIGTDSDGTSDALERNVISGNAEAGVILNSDSNILAGNFIGVDSTGEAALGNQNSGVRLFGTANRVGGDSPSARNVISGTTGDGYGIESSGSGSIIQNNYIGLNATGDEALPNASTGIEVVSGSGNLIGGADRGNVISGHSGPGIRFQDSTGNRVQGNLIGTSASGLSALPNSVGILLASGAADNFIGTDGDGDADAAEGNVISGNIGDGLAIQGTAATSNVVAGNLIGLAIDGTTPLGNTGNGISTEQFGNRIGTDGNGTSDAVERNVISANGLDGIVITAGSDQVVAGNYIGTDITGTVARGNAGSGVRVSGSSGTLLGGSLASHRNVISGNPSGVTVDTGSAGTRIANNFIGTDVTGTVLVPNTDTGIVVDGAADVTTIGGVGKGNVIGGGDTGIVTQALAAGGSVVIQSNWIGTDVSTVRDLGQVSDGIRAQHRTYVGGIGPGEANVITNHETGVRVVGTAPATIRGNRIYDNTALGIDLETDTSKPFLNTAVAGAETVITGDLFASDGIYDLDFYADRGSVAAGTGEGKRFLGSLTVTVSSGQAAFETSGLTYTLDGEAVTATATANDSGGRTSEFSTSIVATTTLPPTIDQDSLLTYIVDDELEGASFGLPTREVDEGTPLFLTGDFSNINGTASVTIDWGDGTVSTSSDLQAIDSSSFTALHVYEDDDPTATPSDDYAVTVTVTDDVGSGSATLLVTVNNVAPTLGDFTLSETVIVEGGEVTLSGSFADPGLGDQHRLQIDWGDATAPQSIVVPLGSRSFAATHTYSQDTVDLPGLITVTLQDDDAAVVNRSTVVTVQNAAPQASINLPSSPIEGIQTTISANVFDPGGDPVTYQWVIAGEVFDTETVSFKPSNDGDFDVSLTVTDDRGAASTVNATLVVGNAPPVLQPTSVSIRSSLPNVPVTEGVEIVLSGVFDDTGLSDAHQIEVDFGDGTPLQIIPIEFGGRAYDDIRHTYIDDPEGIDDTYNVSVTLRDENDASTVIVPLSVPNFIPEVALRSESTGADEVTVGAQVTDRGAQDGQFFEWIIDNSPFISGNVAAGDPIPSITFPNPQGNVEIIFRSTDDDDGVGETIVRYFVFDDSSNTIDISATGGNGLEVKSGDVTTPVSGVDQILVAAGGGNDVINVDSSASASPISIQADLGDGDDVINSGGGSDVIITGGGDDLVNAGDGDDVIVSSMGNDTINAGSGENEVVFELFSDKTLIDGGGIETLNFERVPVAGIGGAVEGISLNLSQDNGTPQTVYSTTGTISLQGTFENVIGSRFADSLIGNDARNVLFGGLGDDSLSSGGSGGGDTIDGGTGDDSIFGGPGGDDSIVGGDGNDTITSGDGNNDTIFGGSGNDSITSGGGDDTIAGGDGDDSIFGGASGNESIDGGLGDDVIRGDTVGDGHDSIFGGPGNDSIISGGAGDTVSGGDGDDSIFGGPGGNESISGGSGDDSIVGGDGDTDSIFGGPGDDSISSGAGDDTIDGGDGDDSIFGGPGGDESIDGGSGDDTIVGGGDGHDTIFGGTGNDSITSGGGNDTIDGGGGQDTIFGGPGGNESISGGAGNDSIAVGNGAGDSIFGGPGNDSIQGGSDDPTDSRGDTIDGGSGDDSIFGGPGGNESISGGAGNDSIEAGDGAADSIFGGPGDDSIQGSRGDDASDNIGDTIQGGSGNDTIFGGPGGDESIDGGSGDDSIVSGIGSGDSVFGGAGNDSIQNAGGNDTISGGDGEDTIFGGSNGDESIDGGSGNDTINAGQGGDDTIFGGPGDDSIVGGGNDADTLLGGDGDDSIFGGVGNDSIAGGDGNDSIVSGGDPQSGGPGDTVFGGAGDDSIVSTGNSDTIDGGSGDDSIFGGPGGNESISGGEGDDTILGGDGDGDSIYGGPGDDSLISGGGNADTVSGGEGHDTIFGGPGSGESIDGGSGDDSITTGGGSDSIFGGLGDDSIISTGGGDTINAGDGDDSIFGGPGGNDSIQGAAGNDTINAGGGSNDTVFGGPGDDWIELELGSANVFGDSDLVLDPSSTDRVVIEQDANISVTKGAAANQYRLSVDGAVIAELTDIDELVLIGGPGDNTLDAAQFAGNAALAGLGGNDRLLGGEGNDSLEGGAGDDFLSGGGGGDRYLFVGAGDLGIDIIDEAPDADHDTLDFFGLDTAVDVNLEKTSQQSIATGLALQFTSPGALEGVIGTTFADKLTGNARNNSLVGGGGIDSVFGGAGDDVISASRTKRIYLDFDSETDAGDHLYTQDEREKIAARVIQDYAAFDVQITLSKPLDPGFITVFFNNPPEINGRAFSGGVADRIGWRDVARGGSVKVDVNGFFGTGRNQLPPTDDNFIALSSTIASHELGHMMGLRHHDSFGAPGEGIFSVLGGTAFLPNYDEMLAAAPETAEHLIASPASVRTTLTDALADPYFGEREALKLAFSETGLSVIESPVAKTETLFLRGENHLVQPLGDLRPLSVPNTIENPNARNYGIDLGASATNVIGSIEIDPISNRSENDIYSFQASAGDVITVEALSVALRTRIDFTVDTLIRVYGSDGQKLDYYGSPLGAFNDDGFEPTDSILIDVKIPDDGTYFVELDSFHFGIEEFSGYVPDFDVDAFCSDSSGDIRCEDTDTGDYELLIYRFDSNPTSTVGDVIVGGSGADTLIGSSGNDFFLTDSSDSFQGPTSNQTIATNTAPVIAPFASALINEGERLRLTPIATDTDFADEIRFELQEVGDGSTFPVGASIDPNSGEIIWDTPDNGVYETLVTVTDLSGEVASQRLTITVENVAPQPALVSIAGTFEEAKPISVVGSATDAVGDIATLTFLYEAILGTNIVDSESGIGLTDYSFTPPDDGTYSIRLTVTDKDGDSDFDSRSVIVTNVVPTAIDDAYATDQGTPITLTATEGLLGNDSDPADPLIVTKINDSDLVPGGAITLPSGAVLQVESDGRFEYDPAGKFDSLPAGVSEIDSFNYGVSDGNVELVRTVRITMTGTNDQPLIDAVDVAGTVIEDSAALLSDSGLLIATDVDRDSVLEGSVSLTGVATTGPPVSGDLSTALAVALSITQSADGTVDWDFAIDDVIVQYLREGEQVVATYGITIDDGTGAANSFAQQDITIVIAGRNDRPTIAAIDLVGDLIEDSALTLSDDGSLNFSDDDQSDAILSTVSLHSVSTTGPALPDALAAALESAVVLNQEGSNDGTVNWVFDVNNALVQYLSHHEGVTAVYTVSLADDSGAANATASEQVTVSIAGRNDQPDVTVVDVTGSVVEDGFVTLRDAGSVLMTDADANDIVSQSVALAGAVSDGPPIPANVASALTLAMTLSQGSKNSVNWDFAIDNAIVQYLGTDESIDATYTIAFSDDSGQPNAVTTQDVTIRIDGRNDRPQISIVDIDGTVTEGDAASLTESGSLTFTDSEHTDVLEALVSSTRSETNSAPIPDELRLALSTALTLTQTGTRDGVVAWDFSVDNTLVEYLTNGETVTATYTIELRDDSGSDNASESVDVSVVIHGTNSVPQLTQIISTSGSLDTTGKVHSPVTLSGTFFDDNPMDTHTVTVNWGDGSPAENIVVVQNSPEPRDGIFSGDHEYATGGIFEVMVSIDDGNGGTDVQWTRSFITGIGLVNGTLYVIGTDGEDEVEVDQKKDGWIKVELEVDDRDHHRHGHHDHDHHDHDHHDHDHHDHDHHDHDDDDHCDGKHDDDCEFSGKFDEALVDRIAVYLRGDDDEAEVDTKKPSLIDGGDGDDELEGGDGRDVLIGGRGKDEIEGGGGQDILLDGRFIGTPDDLSQLQSIWSGTGSYLQRVVALTEPGGQLHQAANAENDDSKDDLEGDDSLDLFFLELGRDDDDRGGHEIALSDAAVETPPDPSTATLSGFVWHDVDRDGLIGMNENAVADVSVSLYNEAGHFVATTTTDSQGSYSFVGLPAGDYRIVEQQPAGYSDGEAFTQNGGRAGTNQVSGIELNATEVLTNFNFSDYVTGASNLQSGQTATIGFWYGKTGQRVIRELNGTGRATGLGHYLADHFPNMFGDFAGLSNDKIKSTYSRLYKERYIKSDDAERTKLELEVLSLAISSYVTTRSLVQVNQKTENVDDPKLLEKLERYGVVVTETGIGATTYDLSVWINNPFTESDIRAAFGLSQSDSLVMSVIDILRATDLQSASVTAGSLYDADGNGISDMEQILRSIANSVYADINQAGSV